MPSLGIPQPIKDLFDQFPFTTYPANSLPLSSPTNQYPTKNPRSILYIWSNEEGALAGRPSYNPTCLKTQTYLKFLRVDFGVRCSRNHSSPSGGLPFLTTNQPSSLPIRNSKLPEWGRAHSSIPLSDRQSAEQVDIEAVDPIHSVLDGQIRPAYLNALYLDTQTAAEVAYPRYVDSTTSTHIVRAELARQLRNAAYDEIAASGQLVEADGHALLVQAARALARLDARLGRRTWFSVAGAQGSSSSTSSSPPPQQQQQQQQQSQQRAARAAEARQVPGLLDAAVFAYTHVILLLFDNQRPESPAGRLHGELSKHINLVAHHRRVLEQYYDGVSA